MNDEPFNRVENGSGGTGHGSDGKFTVGNPGGPGRPRRAVERDYVSLVAHVCPPATWRRIVERAAIDAEAGDAKARDWLAKYLTGANPESLWSIAGKDANGQTIEAELQTWAERDAADDRRQSQLDAILNRFDE